MGPSHDEVAVNRTSVERGCEGIVAANRWPLGWLNFFLADVKDGLGPFLAISRLRGWQRSSRAGQEGRSSTPSAGSGH